MKSSIEEIKEMFHESFLKDKKVDRNTRLQSDLGIYGEDAIEFLEKFADRFNVDISEFNVDRYFRQEGFDPFFALKKVLKLVPDFNELTISDLEKAIENKKLI